ncbi:MAG TPA: FAD-dependent oxidoreductase, partial [Rhodocyclaceae bacterium]|nr:FAD-dependent oxidoreductase [Rhodocyclaceae bacterium]
MDKSELQAWESRCIQEEPPPCQTGCPIHVDARQFLKHAAKGQWNEALKTLARTMPFPGILGRICDRPCEQVCKRAEAGGTIAIGRLERTCVETAGTAPRPLLLSRKPIRVAVVGSGLGSLAAAWDLLRKGYRVTLLEPGERLGGALRDYPESLLPA